MSCHDFACGYIPLGQEDPIKLAMDQYLKEPVNIDVPKGAKSWNTNTKVDVVGTTATKIVTRVCKMADGSQKTITQKYRRELQV